MTTNELLASLNVGDKITFQCIVGNTKPRTIEKTGTIKQKLKKFITVKTDKYPESIEIQQIANGKIVILDANGNPIPIEHEKQTITPLPAENTSPNYLKPEQPATYTPGQCVRTNRGKVNWDIMWPLVEPELAKGRSKYEVADEFGIGHDAMKSRCKRVRIAKDSDHQMGINRFKGKSREELLAVKERLHQQELVIDIIVSCIDATLAKVGDKP